MTNLLPLETTIGRARRGRVPQAAAIPRVLHRIWFNDRPRPAIYDEYWRRWAALNPGWDLHTWTERNVPPLRNQAEYDRCEYPTSAGTRIATARATAVHRADIAAYEIVWRFGGVYVHCDVQPLRPLDDLLVHQAFAGVDDDLYLCNAVLGGEPGSLFFDAVIKELPFAVAANPRADTDVQTGRQLLTAMWRAMPDRITVLPREASCWESVPNGRVLLTRDRRGEHSYQALNVPHRFVD